MRWLKSVLRSLLELFKALSKRLECEAGQSGGFAHGGDGLAELYQLLEDEFREVKVTAGDLLESAHAAAARAGALVAAMPFTEQSS